MKLAIKMRLGDFERTPLESMTFDWVEVHVHNFAERARYLPILQHFRRLSGVRVGIHYAWPLDAEGGWLIPTFAVDHAGVRDATLAHLRTSIEWAAEQGVEYVLYHAGPRRLARVDEETGRLSHVDGAETPEARSAALFLEHAVALAEEGRRRGVELVVESETQRKAVNFMYGPLEGSPLIELGEQSPETILALARAGGSICVDFANLVTAFSSPDGTTPREVLFARLRDFCRRVLPARMLVVHVVGVLPPFVRDSRSGLTNLEVEDGVFPNRAETVALLGELADHPNVIVLPEGETWNAPWHNELLEDLLATVRGRGDEAGGAAAGLR